MELDQDNTPCFTPQAPTTNSLSILKYLYSAFLL